MSAVGFDLGNDTCVVAVARQRGIDVVLNQESKRETPALVSFGARQRLLGAAATSSALMNPAGSISQIKRLVGRGFSELQRELPLLPFRVTEGPDGLPRIDVQYLGERRAFTPTQALAMLLAHLRTLAETHLGAPVAECCIGVPAFFTDAQRRAVLDASAIAGLRPLRLVNEATAAALEYGIRKTELPDPEGRALNVAFVDVGHASTQVCVTAYWKGQVRVLAHAFDPSLGGRDLDDALFRHFAAEFRGKTGIDISSNARACARLRVACEKLKKMLSANAEAPLNVECLVEDRDFRGFLRREELERICDPILRRVRGPLEKGVRDSGLRVEEIHVVELLGSGSRVPAISRILTEFFGKEPRRTMNASECVARGCALHCAMFSPKLRVRQFEVHENFPFNVDVFWKKLSSESSEAGAQVGKSSRAFSKGDPIPITKTLQLSTESLPSVNLIYADASELGVPELISQYKIDACKNEITDYELVVSLNLHGVLSLDSVYMVEEAGVRISAKTLPAAEFSKQETIDASSATTKDLGMEEDKLVPVLKDPEVDSSKVGTSEAFDQSSTAQDVRQTEGTDKAISATKAESENGIQNTETDDKNELHKADPKAEVVKKYKRKIILGCDCIHGGISPTNLQTLIEEEYEMALQDKVIEETKDRKNSVETYVYDMRNKISDIYKDFVSDTDREVFSIKLQEAEDWLYEEGEDASKGVYIEKLNELKAIGDPIEIRYKEDSERQLTGSQLAHCIRSFQDAVLTNDPRLDHIDIKEKQKVLDACIKAQNWLNHKWQQQVNLPKHANPVLLSADITRFMQEFDRYCKGILLKPNPESHKTQKPQVDASQPPQAEAAKEQPPVGGGSSKNQSSAVENFEPPVQTANGVHGESTIEESSTS